MKPYYDKNGITIYHGDCLKVMPKLEGLFDALISDWPYGTTANAWDKMIPLAPLWSQVLRLIKRNGAIMATAKEPFTSKVILSQEELFRYRWTWRKNSVTRWLDSANRPLDDYEDIPVFYRREPTWNPQMTKGAPNHTRNAQAGKVNNGNYGDHKTTKGKVTTDKHPRLVIDFDVVPPSESLHKVQKPEPLFAYLIRTYTNPGEIVLDNTAGVGTTLVAAQNEGRRAVGAEISEEYCRIAVDRLRQLSFFSLPSPPKKDSEQLKMFD